MNCFIVGGGSSLDEIDLSRLKGRDVIVCNEGILVYPDPTVLVWLDADFYPRFRKHIDGKPFKKYCRSTVMTCQYADDIEPLLTAPLYPGFHGRDGLKRGIYSGEEKLTGIAAVSLAIALGYDKIYLLGYDGGEVDGKLHFTGYTNKERDVYSKRLNRYEVFKGYDIVNCSLKSRIKTFPKQRIEDVLSAV